AAYRLVSTRCSTRSKITCFFFSSRRRHTRWPRDWSSDVCSSDLKPAFAAICFIVRRALEEPTKQIAANAGFEGGVVVEKVRSLEIGRASCRERVEISGVGESVEKKK